MGNSQLLSIDRLAVRYGKETVLQIDAPISIEKETGSAS